MKTIERFVGLAGAVVWFFFFLSCASSGDDDTADDGGTDVSADDSAAADDSADDDAGDDDSLPDDDGDDDTAPDLVDYGYVPPEPSDAIGVFVAKTGDDANLGTMAAPVLTFGKGMEIAELAGKSVFAARGEYSESVLMTVSLYGGYEEQGWTRDIDAYETAVVAPPGAPFAASTLNPRLTVEGFTISGGGYITEHSPAVAIKVFTSEVTLRWNKIKGGETFIFSWDDSIGLHIAQASSVLVISNVIEGGTTHSFEISNSSYAVLIGGAQGVTLVNNVLRGGKVLGLGGGSYGLSAQLAQGVVLVNNLVETSEAHFRCGVDILCSEARLLHNDIRTALGNPSAGVSIWRTFDLPSPPVDLVNNIFSAPDSDEGVGVWLGETFPKNILSLAGNDFYGQGSFLPLRAKEIEIFEMSEINGCEWDGCASAAGNIAEDPLFAPDGWHLTAASMCIDAGADPAAWYDDLWEDYDSDFNRRPRGAGWDIGRDEYAP